MLEDAVPKPRASSSPFLRALDLLFVQAFKSHGSLYFLCVHGHGEDGATVARRMLEIEIQARYLCADTAEQEIRGQKFLAYFWAQAPNRIKAAGSDAERAKWQTGYDANKHLLLRPSGHQIRNWWGDDKIKQLANLPGVGLKDAYDQDFRVLSQMAHCTSQGILFRRAGDVMEIRTDILVSEILIFGTRYILDVTRLWNGQFNLIDGVDLAQLSSEAERFVFQMSSA